MDAILFYGFDVHDDETGEVFLPEEFFDAYKDPDDGEEDIATDTFLSRACEGQEVISHDHHGTSDEPVHFIYTVAHTATAGYPIPLIEAEMKIDPDWDIQLAAFCKRTGIPWRQPSWHLASYWG